MAEEVSTLSQETKDHLAALKVCSVAVSKMLAMSRLAPNPGECYLYIDRELQRVIEGVSGTIHHQTCDMDIEEAAALLGKIFLAVERIDRLAEGGLPKTDQDPS